MKREELGAAALCAVVGLVLSVLPHLTRWGELGGPVWIADPDELFYLEVGAQAYENHPLTLADPVQAEPSRCIYRWLPLGPGVVAARAAGGGPLSIGLVWRVLGGLTTGLGLFFTFRAALGRAWPAAASVAVLLADTGLVDGRPLQRQAEILVALARSRAGDLFAGKPQLFSHWRIATPALTMVYFCLHIGLVLRARDRPTWPRLIASGVGFGLLFYVYFYNWTAAGLALLLGLAIDAGHRRVYLHTGWIGGLVGLPALLGDVATKRSTPPDWLLRTDKFLPIPRLSELLIPFGSAGLLLAALALTWRWRRDLLYLALLAVAGLLLANHQVVTGLQIENFHYVYTWGVALSLLLAGLASAGLRARMPSGRRATAVVAVACAGYVLLGGWLRWQEAVRTRVPRQILDDYARYRAQRLGPGAPPLAPNAVIAGDPSFVVLASILENQRPLDGYAVVLSPTVVDAEWDDRVALNAYLSGQDAAVYRASRRATLDALHWGPWPRDPARLRQKFDAQLAAYEAIAIDPAVAVDRLGVAYVAGAVGGPAPPASPGVSWMPLQSGPNWGLWQRTTPAPAAPGQLGTP